MGMVNFIGKFIPNLKSRTSCMCELLHKESEFKWTVRHEREWQQLKNMLTTAPVLSFYDHTKKIKLSTDASKDGICAVLLQAEGEHWKPVAYASRAMTKAECRYAQIEKECLGLAYGLERFHNYVYGLPSFTAETDHRPLVSIIKKNLNEMSPRIQRLMMKMQRYDFDLIYTPGKHLILADALSRAPAGKSVSATEEDIQCHVNMVSSALPVSDTKSRQIAEATAKDVQLQHVMRNMDEGWPVGANPQFYHVRGELSVVDGLLLKRGRIVIPQALRMDMLRRIHEGHLGIEKCKRRAKESVFWPGINKDIETFISKCETCQKHRSKQSKDPMVVSELAVAPWHKVGMDLFHLRGKDYLVVIDYYSNFSEMALLTNS
uniref:Gypsy retrotransposon integrase-like protein 1 n=1 Tax=Oryzias sinensis TaxID=183150 RepID=A0A8C8DE10_9TELE